MRVKCYTSLLAQTLILKDWKTTKVIHRNICILFYLGENRLNSQFTNYFLVVQEIMHFKENVYYQGKKKRGGGEGEEKKKVKDFLFRHNKELYLEALLSLILIFSLTYLAWIHNLADILSKVSTVSEIISLFCMAKLFTLVMLKWITLRGSDFSWQLIEIRDTTLVIILQMSSLFAFSSDSQLLATSSLC